MKDRPDSQMARLHRKLQAEETSRVFARLADTFRRSDHLEEAIEVCHRGLVHHPEYVSGHIVLGQCYLDLGRLEEARDCFLRALALDENNILTLRNLGNILFRQGELEEAAEHYRRALQLEPRNTDLRERLREAEIRLAEPAVMQQEPGSGEETGVGEEPAGPEEESQEEQREKQREEEEESHGRADPPSDSAFSGSAMMSIPAFGREVLEPTDTEEHRRWLREMTRGADDVARGPDEGVRDVESDDPDPKTGPGESGFETAGAMPRDPASESHDPVEDPKSSLPDAQLSPEETELLRDDQDEHSAKGPPRGMATATLAEIYFQQGYLDKAIEIYIKVLRHDPDDERSRIRLSELRAMRSGRSEEQTEEGEESAGSDLNQAGASDPQGEPSS